MFATQLSQLYSLTFPLRAVVILSQKRGSALALLSWFWQARQFSAETAPVGRLGRAVALLLSLLAVLQICVGLALLIGWARYGTAGSWEFGIALLLSYPLVSVHLLALLAGIWKAAYYLLHPKKAGRAVVCSLLERQVRRLRAQHQFQIVAVAGSVGKTSTKLAIAELLSATKRVKHQTGNYNDRVTVPLVFFSQNEPHILNILAWLRIFWSNARALHRPYPYDVVVLEIGTDGPGFMREFAYLRPDISVLTAITPEHMEYFKTLDAVAAEELTVFDYSTQVLVNGDTVPGKYLIGHNFYEYSLTSEQADYYAKQTDKGLDGQTLALRLKGKSYTAHVSLIGTPGASFALAAAAVADLLGVKATTLSGALAKLSHFAGRMQLLAGRGNARLIDDTYNASPVAVIAALDVLCAAAAPQRIAILGSMNELGDYSQEAHQTVGNYCDPKKLDIVLTIGADAKKWLAPAAKKQGCNVKSFTSPYEAGDYAARILKPGAIVLAKGSQNGVFAEEALKPLLAKPADAAKLVRQSSYWLAQKAKQFPH